MDIRHVQVEDYVKVRSVIDAWWGGRTMAHLLPRLFFEHFQPTSYVIEQQGELVAFLIGFMSQTDEQQAYIHFVGVAPHARKKGYAQTLYTRFFEQVKARGCREVRCITTPVNSGSIAFHEALGFDYTLHEHYAGEGEHRIVFNKTLM